MTYHLNAPIDFALNNGERAFAGNSQGSQVLWVYQSDDLGKIKVAETKVERAAGSLGCVTFTPIRLIEQVSDLGLLCFGQELQASPTDDLIAAQLGQGPIAIAIPLPM